MNLRDERVRSWAVGLLAALLTGVGHMAAFPFAFSGGELLSVSEAAYLFLVPLALWLATGPGWRQVALCVGGAMWLSWCVLLWWLRHVTLPGTVLLAGMLAVFPTLWALAGRWALPRMQGRAAPVRLAVVAGLAGVWVLLEWLRSWVLSGFPWLPLAASQWDRPAVLQMLSVTGYLGLGWVLVFFNLGIAQYVRSLLRPRRDLAWFRRLSPELYASLGLLVLAFLAMVPARKARQAPEPLFTAGFVQPYVGHEKWSDAHRDDILKRLTMHTTYAMHQGAQVVLWPEAATPGPVVAPNRMYQQWVEQLVRSTHVTLLMGSIAYVPTEEPDNPEGERPKYNIYNGIFVADSAVGLREGYYSKRKLVPFGEYNPLSFLPFDLTMGQVGETARGDGVVILPVHAGGRDWRAGPLVCYEDIFPSLARETVAQGADFLFVATNNAWYGEEAGAYQHALHSVLRAVENRRPVLRSGNGGWSGWIDEYGGIAHVAVRPEQGVYFEGNDVVEILRDPAWAGQRTFYNRFGDWFAGFALILIALGLAALRYGPSTPTPEHDPTPRERAREMLRRGKLRRRF